LLPIKHDIRFTRIEAANLTSQWHNLDAIQIFI
jgi:hypothetical protein